MRCFDLCQRRSRLTGIALDRRLEVGDMEFSFRRLGSLLSRHVAAIPASRSLHARRVISGAGPNWILPATSFMQGVITALGGAGLVPIRCSNKRRSGHACHARHPGPAPAYRCVLCRRWPGEWCAAPISPHVSQMRSWLGASAASWRQRVWESSPVGYRSRWRGQSLTSSTVSV